MKKLMIGIAATLLVSACASTPAPAPAPAAPKKAPEEIKTLKVTGFETPAKFQTYTGPGSEIAYSFVTDPVHEGKQALQVKYQTQNWAGLVVSGPSNLMNWTGMTTFKMWVFGGGSGLRYELQVEDKEGELFIHKIPDDFKGWKQLVIPLASIGHRGDYQNPTSKSNDKIDYPIKDFQISTNQGSGGKGSIVLTVDDVEVTDE